MDDLGEQAFFNPAAILKKAVLYLLFLAIFALLGFAREFLFVNINNQLYILYYGHSSLEVPASLQFITRFDYTTLYYSKYGWTALFFTLYFFATFLCVRRLGFDKKFSRWAVYIYALLLILSVISMAWGYFVHNRIGDEEYSFSRWIMGIAQSPLVAFFLVASAALYQSFQNKSYEKRFPDL